MPIEPAFNLVLDADEAGYLRELLYTCIGGGLVCTGEPLGRILQALDSAGVPLRRIRNLNSEAPQDERRAVPSVWAVNDESADGWKWWDTDDFFNYPPDDIDYLDDYR